MSHCPNLVFTCMDYRFPATYNRFIEQLDEADRVALAGAAKAITDKDTRATSLKQIELSQKLHNIKSVYLLDHEDCGGYGGKAQFESDEAEIKEHAKIAAQAREIILNKLPDIHVITKMCMLDGSVIDL